MSELEGKSVITDSGEQKSALILYSGGLDSTFVCARVAPEFDRLYLITYIVPSMYGRKRALIHLEELRSYCGSDKIIHEYIDLRRLILKIRGGFFRIVRDCFRYNFAKPLCVGCKIVMHLNTIRYCRQHGISRVMDGNVRVESSHALEQRPVFIERMRSLYRQYGITYESPIYDYNQVNLNEVGKSVMDKLCLQDNRQREKEELKRMGFTLGKPIGDMHRSIQPQCWMNPPFGLLGVIWKADDSDLMYYTDDKIKYALNKLGEGWLLGEE